MALHESMMVLLGMGMLIASLLPMATIFKMLGTSNLRRHWQVLRALILSCVVGYLALVFMQVGKPHDPINLIISLILLAGGAFVLIVVHLSALTTADLVRVATLEAEVVLDPLTGAFNRRYMNKVLPMAMAKARRTGGALSALMIDLDHFKHINDTYGHPVGDLVLQRISSLIIENSRAADTVVRFGGEEFLVIAPETDLDAAEGLGERMRERIVIETVTLPDGRTVNATASIGVAALSTGDNGDDLLGRADEALYAAKANGRNRVALA